LVATNTSVGAVKYKWEVSGSAGSLPQSTTSENKDLTKLDRIALVKAGTYTVTLTVTNAAGVTTKIEKQLTLSAPYLMMTPLSWSIPTMPRTKSATLAWDNKDSAAKPDFYVYFIFVTDFGNGGSRGGFVYGDRYWDTEPPYILDKPFTFNSPDTKPFDRLEKVNFTRGYTISMGAADSYFGDGAGEDGETAWKPVPDLSTSSVGYNDLLFLKEIDMLQYWLDNGTSPTNTLTVKGTYQNGSFSAPYECNVRVFFSN